MTKDNDVFCRAVAAMEKRSSGITAFAILHPSVSDPRDLRITFGSDRMGWVVFDAAARDAHPNRVITALFAVGPRPLKTRGLARGNMRGANEAYAWLTRQRYGAPVGKLKARKSDSARGAWYVDDSTGRNYAVADTLAEARDCIRIVERNDPPLPDGFFA